MVADYIYSQLVKLLVVNGHLSCERQFQGDEILSNRSTSSTFLYLLTHSIYFIAIYAQDRYERYNYWKPLNLLVSCDSFRLKERFQIIIPYTKMIKLSWFFIKAVLSILRFHVAGEDFIVCVQMFVYIWYPTSSATITSFC